MSTTTNDTSDVKEAADHADVTQIKKNLEDQKQTDAPESLTEEQKAPFIDEEVRTDK
ncbi:hypothetical protein [Psychrobacter sp. CAL346-MNA-CIBAN-0220]|uniref:hypothetical protein n=1 Tax=Psychrobacter sp. CAL346-MNA-CIBAN-0220 TaxID=3140457 RepID=UPI003323853F